MRILASKENIKSWVANLEKMLDLENQQFENVVDKIGLGIITKYLHDKLDRPSLEKNGNVAR